MSIDVEPEALPADWRRELCIGFLLSVAVLAAGLLAIL
jgi:hypothetical protein